MKLFSELPVELTTVPVIWRNGKIGNKDTNKHDCMFTINASLIELFHFAVTRQRALEKALRLRAEQSMASTLKDTSEIPVS